MNILVVHEVSYLDKPVYEYQDFAERLAGRGHNVTVIDFNEAKKSNLTMMNVSKTGEGTVELISLPNNGLPVLKYIQAKLSYPRLLKRFLQEKKIDTVLLYSVFINGTATVSISKKLGIPVVYRAIDAYHRLRKNYLESRLLLAGEKYIYNNVNAVSATNNKMGDYVQSMVPMDSKIPIYITDHGVDTNHFKRIEKDLVLAGDLNVKDEDFVCVFLGTTYEFSRLDSLVNYLGMLRSEIHNFKLLILGAGELDDRIRKTVSETGQNDLVLQPGMISYDDLPKYLSLAKIAINPFEINDITRDIIPIKILQYLASELPIVSTPLPDVVAKIPENVSGVYYSKNDDLESFVDRLIEIATTIDLHKAGNIARNYVEHHHSMDRVIDEMEGILEQKWNI